MRARYTLPVIVVLLLFLCSLPVFAQQSAPSEISDLRRDVDTLKQEVRSIKEQLVRLQEETGRRFQVAVFPASVSGAGSDYDDVVSDAVERVFENTDLFVPKYSYFPLHEKLHARPLPKNIEPDSVWSRASAFADYKPQIDKVLELGRQLGVDTVFMYSVIITGTPKDTISAYVLDVHTGKTYLQERRTPLKDVRTNVLFIKTNEMVAVAEKAFWEYKQDKGL